MTPLFRVTVALALALDSSIVLAEDNYWTNATSGYWQQPHWSLGVLPTNGQTVSLMNAGSKALVIDWNTTLNYSNTLDLSRLVISSVGESRNTLLLNYAGLDVPLSAWDLFVGANSTLISLSSRFNFGKLNLEGDMEQLDRSEGWISELRMTSTNQATYTLRNSMLGMWALKLGSGTAQGQATFQHRSGTNELLGGISVAHGARYILEGGLLLQRGFMGGAYISGAFEQRGGLAAWTNDLMLGGGTPGAPIYGEYVLYGGTLTAPSIRGTSGTFVQYGGTSFVSTVQSPELNTLWNTYIEIHGGMFYSGKIEHSGYRGYTRYHQDGGVHINSNGISIASHSVRYFGGGSSYNMSGGELKAPFISANSGSFGQSGGEVYTEHFSVAQGGSASVYDGLLDTTTMNISGFETESHPGTGMYYRSSGFTHKGGQVRINGGLYIGRNFYYHGGWLTAENVTLSTSGLFEIKASLVRNRGQFIFSGGELHSYVSSELGWLILRTNTDVTISKLRFMGAQTVRFAGISGESWHPGGFLVVQNWRSGETQLLVGSINGLTSQQLRQIIFENPGKEGDYAARILASGEVVPDSPLGLACDRAENGSLVFRWPEPYLLQTTTNLANASGWTTLAQTSPMTIDCSEPRRFYRVRR